MTARSTTEAPFDLVVRGGTLVTADAVTTGDVAIRDGRVAVVAPRVEGPTAEAVDATGLHVLPGGVDPHVHMDDPGRTRWEGFRLGTAALAAGGVTTIVDMPLDASPPTVDGAALDAKLATAEGSAMVDFALWGGVVPGNVGELDELAARGVVGFKAFMCDSGNPEFPPVDDSVLLDAMRAAARLGRPVAVHAEDERTTRRLAERARAEGRHGMRDWARSRPIRAEVDAVERAITLAAEARCALHVVHVSSGAAASAIADARARGLDVTCEVCPHHLLLTEDDGERLGAVAKCAPPLRPPSEPPLLWRALSAGEVDWVASDHAPAPPDAKRGDDAFAYASGITGGQSSLELLLTEALSGDRLSLPQIATVFARSASRRLALPGKGELRPGADADLTLVALRRHRALAAGELRHRHAQSPYLGRDLRARVVRTVVRGVTVSVRGRPVGARPIGRYLAAVGTTPRPHDERPTA